MDISFDKLKSGLQRTKTMLVRNVQALFIDTEEWGEAQYDQLEEALIGADLGIQITQALVADIRKQYERGLIRTSADIISASKDHLHGLLTTIEHGQIAQAVSGPTVIMMIGVNGSGKTTTTAKLAHLWKRDGKSVALAACDTFRAAAIEQIKIWGQRLDCPVISSTYGADAAAVAHDAVSAAMARNIDILLVDTAGRQHTKVGLMNELAKIHRIINKVCPGAPHESWLVVDGSTGTNALQQARTFKETAGITGLCLTKLDGTSKGGVVVPIHQELGLPIRFIGLGEAAEDLQPFDARMFVDALFAT